MKVEDLLKKLLNGGAIVSSNDLSHEDVVKAREEDRLFVDEDSYGYVYVPIEE